jgi:anti-anti-sigma factor
MADGPPRSPAGDIGDVPGIDAGSARPGDLAAGHAGPDGMGCRPLDVCNAERVAEVLASAVSQGGSVTADMSTTTFCDCAGARAIVQARKRAAASGSELRVVVTTPQVRRLFGCWKLMAC